MSFPNNRHGNTPPYLLSAYGIAVKHGYSGTEEDWLASLKGDQGEYPRMQFDSETGYLQIRYDDSGEWTDIASLADLMTESEEAVVASAKEYADTAEAYAKGTVDDEAVEEGDPGYEDNAKYYAGQASTYASAAGGFATGASNYAQAASGYATTASGHADNAATSATAAAGSATSAAGSAASASTSAGSASTSASAAEAQATQAGTYAYNADQSAQAAANYAAAANTAYGAVVDVANGVDVKVEDIETQVSIAAGYASAAGTSATNASGSATAAAGSATAAAGSASDAADSATAAAGSATAAAGSATSVSESAAQITTNKNDIADLKSAIDTLANDYLVRLYPEWEDGGLDTDGSEITENATRTADYIDKSSIGLWYIGNHTGALYVFRYNYADGVYTFVGYNQQTQGGDKTSWLLGLSGTHVRFVNYVRNATPNDWMTIGINSNLSADIASLKASQDLTATTEKSLGYWNQYLEIASGASHSAANDKLAVNIKAGQKFIIKFTCNYAFGFDVYATYSDGTSEKITSYGASSFPYAKGIINFTAAKDIIAISQATAARDTFRTSFWEIIAADSASALFDFQKAERTAPRIMLDGDLLYFEVGRARYDVDNIHQCIAIWNNQVWEFGEGKATYNGVEYNIDNGHGNNCNWGKALHGTYPYLYCSTGLQNESKINVFTFDGTTFTLHHAITLDLNLTGYMCAHVDETNERIYALSYSDTSTGDITFTVASLDGTIISTTAMPYRIPIMQGSCMHNGLLYLVSGFGTQASPNYLNIIATNGTLLGRYQMYNIGEIEGIDFMDDEMVLASYYLFYIHPTRIAKQFRLSGIFDQLKAT